MDVLIVDSDDSMVALLTSICIGVLPAARVHGFGFARAALTHWQAQGADLVLTDLNLADGDSLELIRSVRRNQSDIPVLVISASASRESILKVARLGISGFISKPFSVELLQQRLSGLLPQTDAAAGMTITLDQHIAAAANTVIQLPGTLNTGAIIELIQRGDTTDAAELAQLWRSEASVTARLIAVAGGISFRRSGVPVTSLLEAIFALGVPMALNHALALSLDICGQLAHPVLAERAKQLFQQAADIAEQAYTLARQCGQSPVLCHTAGLLSRVGDLAALKLMQQYNDQVEKPLTADDIDDALAAWAQTLGNQIKVQWRLPLPLRELIGAVHFLPRESVSVAKLIMRAAALHECGEADSEEGQWLQRRLGLQSLG